MAVAANRGKMAPARAAIGLVEIRLAAIRPAVIRAAVIRAAVALVESPSPKVVVVATIAETIAETIAAIEIAGEAINR